MAKLPQFAAGELSKIQPAIESGDLQYPAYVFIRDEKKLAFVDKDNTISVVVGDNKKQVVRVDTLPEVSSADIETLYICSGIVYILENGAFKPIYQDYSEQITQINESLQDLTTRVTNVENGQSAIAFSTKSAFPETGKDNMLYVAIDEPEIYLWDTVTAKYVPMNNSESSMQWIEL